MRAWASALALAPMVGACGGANAGDDRAAVLRVVAQGRTALLHDDAAAACRLLTPHARRRVLGFQVDIRPEGSSRRRGVPRTCEQIAYAEFKSEHQANVDPSWTPQGWRIDDSDVVPSGE